MLLLAWLPFVPTVEASDLHLSAPNDTAKETCWTKEQCATDRLPQTETFLVGGQLVGTALWTLNLVCQEGAPFVSGDPQGCTFV